MLQMSLRETVWKSSKSCWEEGSRRREKRKNRKGQNEVKELLKRKVKTEKSGRCVPRGYDWKKGLRLKTDGCKIGWKESRWRDEVGDGREGWLPAGQTCCDDDEDSRIDCEDLRSKK